MGLAEVADIAGIADILQTYCGHIADILQIAVDCGGKRQIVVEGVTGVSRDTSF